MLGLQKDVAVHGQRPVDADEEAAFERALSRGKMKTLAQVQAYEAPVEGGQERERRRLCEDVEVLLQDVTNGFGTRTSLPPIDTSVFGICLLGNIG